MDIYSYFNSSDIAEHCKKINHVFDPLEMAVFVAYSDKTIEEKHNAWNEIISNYPDMPIPQKNCFDACESLHDYLRNFIAWEDKWIEDFFTPSTDTVYRHRVTWDKHDRSSNGCYRTVEKALEDAGECYGWDSWPKYGINQFIIDKEIIDTGESRSISFNSNREIIGYANIGPGSPDTLDDIFIDLPVPFKRGDIVECCDFRFVVDSLPHFDDGRGKKYEEYLIGKYNDRSDMIGWGLFVDDNGILYGDHTGTYDSYQYYRGKLKGKERLLHYVSLFIQGKKREIDLPELLTMQCRIMLEELLANRLDYQNHGCYIREYLLAENRLTEEEKEQIREGNALAPWVANKLTMAQVEFLVAEFGGTKESVQDGLADGGGWYLSSCAGIVHEENHYQRINDSRYNDARKETARLILEKYGRSEKGWVDSYAGQDFKG